MADKIDRKALPQTWIHSHEEDTAEETVFRPASYPLPPSRGRKSFQLKPDGSAISSGPGPDDRSLKAQGKWHMHADKLVVETSSDGGRRSVMQVVLAAPDKLVVKKD